MANKNVRSLEEVRWKRGRQGGGRREVVDNRLGQGQRRQRRRQRNRLSAKLSRPLKSSPIELVSRRNFGAVSWGGAETEKDPREMAVPVSSGAEGAESCLETAVETFNKAVGLGMIGGSRLVRDVEVRAKGDPEGRGELRIAVRSDSIRHTKTGDPVMHQRGGAILCHGGGQRNGLRPTGSAVNNGEKVGVTGGGGERPD